MLSNSVREDSVDSYIKVKIKVSIKDDAFQNILDLRFGYKITKTLSPSLRISFMYFQEEYINGSFISLHQMVKLSNLLHEIYLNGFLLMHPLQGLGSFNVIQQSIDFYPIPELFRVIYNDTVGRDICCSLEVNKISYNSSITDMFIILPDSGRWSCVRH